MPVYTRNPDLLWRREDLHDPSGSDVSDQPAAILFRDGEMISLNGLGAEIWSLCDSRTEDEIVSLLLADYEEEEAVVRRDVAEFLAELEGKGLITSE